MHEILDEGVSVGTVSQEASRTDVPRASLAPGAVAAAADGQAARKSIQTLEELPRHVWPTVPNAAPGFQFHTQVSIGKAILACMLDGGSSINSITEDLLVQILNECRIAGIRLGDPRHPARKLEEWLKEDRVTGIADETRSLSEVQQC